ncbi:MAG TPA: DEAD/DEAH box helicase [Actinomycetales bacterium]|nr:DEAD/DEAH box helicase [Actinomycetales bacterium]
MPTISEDAPPPPDRTFADLGVQPKIVEALAKAGITHPFPIQAMTLPVAMQRHDIIGQAKTGTGKTLGFGIPLLEHVTGPGEDGFEQLDQPGKPQALIIVPTRELAIQVAGDLDQASSLRPVRVLTVYGGRAYEPQVDALAKGIEVVVGTPGRLLDLAQQGHLTLGQARTVVLDEADEMLDLGFLPDVERLLSLTPAGRHTMLFSATMPGPVVAMARRYMSQPTHIRASEPDDLSKTVKNTRQFAYRTHAMDKVELLAKILQARGRGLTIVFSRTKRTAAKVADELTDRGFAAAAIHGDLGQGAREQALRAFRNGKVDVLVATDVAARGIDVDDVTHVVNYQAPEDEKTYLHRIGRTGRAGKQGVAVTFVDWDDLPRWGLINKALDLGLAEPEETYSTSEHIHSELDIPEDVTGRLPRSRRTRAGLEAEEIEDLGETGGKGRGGRSRTDEPRSGAPKSGGRGRGERSHGESRDRDGRGRDEKREHDDQGGERPARRSRTRRRTKGGKPVDAATHAGDQGAASSPAASTPSGRSDGSSGEAGSPAGGSPRRRRRRGGSRGSSGSGPGADAPTTQD